MSPKIKRYAILTPFEQADVVAGIAALQKLDVDVVPTKSGALVVRELAIPQYDEWDIRNILGPDESDLEELADSGDPADNAPAVAALFSRLSDFGVVLIDVDLGEDVGIESGVSGLVRARRYLKGAPAEEISAGLLLNALDPVIERVVLGQIAPSELKAVHAKDVTPGQVAQSLRSHEEESASDSGEVADKPNKRGLFGKFRRHDSGEEMPGKE